jgi:ACT domain-containing protein
MTEPLSFKEQWEAKKLLKKSKKKARNNAMKQHGMDKKTATKAVKNAIKRIQNNPMPQPITKAAARGG